MKVTVIDRLGETSENTHTNSARALKNPTEECHDGDAYLTSTYWICADLRSLMSAHGTMV